MFLVFALGFIVDLIFVKWAIATTERKVLASMVWAWYIQVFGLVAIKLAVIDDRMIVANALGHALGSGAGVLLAKRRKTSQ